MYLFMFVFLFFEFSAIITITLAAWTVGASPTCWAIGDRRPYMLAWAWPWCCTPTICGSAMWPGCCCYCWHYSVSERCSRLAGTPHKVHTRRRVCCPNAILKSDTYHVQLIWEHPTPTKIQILFWLLAESPVLWTAWRMISPKLASRSRMTMRRP